MNKWAVGIDKAGCAFIFENATGYEIASHMDKSNAAYVVELVNGDVADQSLKRELVGRLKAILSFVDSRAINLETGETLVGEAKDLITRVEASL